LANGKTGKTGTFLEQNDPVGYANSARKREFGRVFACFAIRQQSPFLQGEEQDDGKHRLYRCGNRKASLRLPPSQGRQASIRKLAFLMPPL